MIANLWSNIKMKIIMVVGTVNKVCCEHVVLMNYIFSHISRRTIDAGKHDVTKMNYEMEQMGLNTNFMNFYIYILKRVSVFCAHLDTKNSAQKDHAFALSQRFLWKSGYSKERTFHKKYNNTSMLP